MNETNRRVGTTEEVLVVVIALLIAIYATWAAGLSEAAWEMISALFFLAAGFILGRGTK